MAAALGLTHGSYDLRVNAGGPASPARSRSLGTSRPKRDGEGKGKAMKGPSTGYALKDIEWHRLTCFNGLGRTVEQYATRGMFVSVRGRIHYSKWTNKDGIDRYGARSSPRTCGS